MLGHGDRASHRGMEQGPVGHGVEPDPDGYGERLRLERGDERENLSSGCQSAPAHLDRHAGLHACGGVERHLTEDVERSRVEQLEQHVPGGNLLSLIARPRRDHGGERRGERNILTAEPVAQPRDGTGLAAPLEESESVECGLIRQRQDTRTDLARGEAVAGQGGQERDPPRHWGREAERHARSCLAGYLDDVRDWAAMDRRHLDTHWTTRRGFGRRVLLLAGVRPEDQGQHQQPAAVHGSAVRPSNSPSVATARR